MGKLLYFNKKEEGASTFLSDGVKASELRKGIDFNVVSYVVLDSEFNPHSLGGFIEKKTAKLFKQVVGGYEAFAESLVAGKDTQAITETPYPEIEYPVFYRSKDEIDIELATEIGLGVVFYKNEYMLYCPSNKGDPKDAIYEMLRLKVYFQLKHPDHVDQKLKEYFNNYEDVIMSNMIANSVQHMNKLKEIFSNV